MYPQNPWMMDVNVEEIRREVERNLRFKEARNGVDQSRRGRIGSLRRSIGIALSSVGAKLQPTGGPVRQHRTGMDLDPTR